MIYKWPSHSICCHASPNVSSCHPTASTTGAGCPLGNLTKWCMEQGCLRVYCARKSTMEPRASSYITRKKRKVCERKAVVKQELLQHPIPFCADGINSCLMILCFLKDVQLLWREIYLWGCLPATESTQAYNKDSRCKRCIAWTNSCHLEFWKKEKKRKDPQHPPSTVHPQRRPQTDSKARGAQSRYSCKQTHLFAMFSADWSNIPQVQACKLVASSSGWYRWVIWLTLKFADMIQIHWPHLGQQVKHEPHRPAPPTCASGCEGFPGGWRHAPINTENLYPERHTTGCRCPMNAAVQWDL